MTALVGTIETACDEQAFFFEKEKDIMQRDKDYDDIDKDRLGFRSLRDFRTGMEVEEVDYQITDDEVGLE